MIDIEFRQRLLYQIKVTKERKQILERQQFELKSQIGELERELLELKVALTVHDRIQGIKTENPSLVASAPFRFGSTADACAELMEELGGQAKVGLLTTRLIEAGKLTNSYKTSYSTIMKALQRDDRFMWITRGEYALKEISRP
ncbi:MAG: hypothetical protein SVK08_00720 [Halobacteriota archaeon]|nr:hypothetical protein [Halobacteriota archaeon]